jgi:hypothetical protein
MFIFLFLGSYVDRRLVFSSSPPLDCLEADNDYLLRVAERRTVCRDSNSIAITRDGGDQIVPAAPVQQTCSPTSARRTCFFTPLPFTLGPSVQCLASGCCTCLYSYTHCRSLHSSRVLSLTNADKQLRRACIDAPTCLKAFDLA